jgi:hypothetical protein
MGSAIFFTPIALFLGILSGGSGHGNYIIAKLLFPWTMLSTVTNESITAPFVYLAIAQFPFYGLMFATGSYFRVFRASAICLSFIHLIGVILSFIFVDSSFS